MEQDVRIAGREDDQDDVKDVEVNTWARQWDIYLLLG